MPSACNHYADLIKLPLAVAYHQRASRSWARGDLEAALADADLAISHDSHAPYHTTRAILLNAMNRGTEARAAIADAFQHFAKAEPEYSWRDERQDNSKDLSRAYLTRGILAWHEGQRDAAAADLRQACKLHSSPQVMKLMADILDKMGLG